MPNSSPSSSSSPPAGPLQHRLPVLLRHAWYGLNQSFRRRLVPLGLTPDQYTVLRTLSENKGICQKDLAGLMASDPNTIASLLDRMESLGLVDRKPRRLDRRVLSLRLRPAGRRKFETARAIASELQAEILNGLPVFRQAAFLADLAVIAGACQLVSRGTTKGRQSGECGLAGSEAAERGG